MIYVAGYPSHIGGASTELWHTLKMWRGGGLDVTLIPTWPKDLPNPDPWRKRIEDLGCKIIVTEPDDLHRIAGLGDSTIVAFCNTRFIKHASKFQGLGTAVIWVNCMNWQFPQERLHYQGFPLFEHYVFQSNYQRDQIIPQLKKRGFEEHRSSIIRGAFDPGEFPHEPRGHDRGSRFYIGRISRNGIDKFPADLFAQYKQIPYPTSARIMGWSQEVEDKLGTPPVWAECLPQSTEASLEFLRSLHAMVPGLGCCRENWPRVGLEAMAAGVPIVAENAGGWKEMLDGGGITVCSLHRQAYEIARLAWDPQYRMEVICRQFDRLNQTTNPEEIFRRWETVFKSL